MFTYVLSLKLFLIVLLTTQWISWVWCSKSFSCQTKLSWVKLRLCWGWVGAVTIFELIKGPWQDMNCNFCHFYTISLNNNGTIVDHHAELWTFIGIFTRNVQFIQKCPQFSQKNVRMQYLHACEFVHIWIFREGFKKKKLLEISNK